MRFFIEIIKGVIEYMKDLKDKLMKLLASGEDPELVKKLKDVLGEEDLESAPEPGEKEEEGEVALIPSEIPLPPEQFEEIKRLQSQKTQLEYTLGLSYSDFHSKTRNLVDGISKLVAAAKEEQKRIISEFSPEGVDEEYVIASSNKEGEPQTLVLKRVEKVKED